MGLFRDCNLNDHFRQHLTDSAGKTSVSLALVSGLQKRFEKVGFIKPVGQQHVEVKSSDLKSILRVDKVRERQGHPGTHFWLASHDRRLSPRILPLLF